MCDDAAMRKTCLTPEYHEWEAVLGFRLADAMRAVPPDVYVALLRFLIETCKSELDMLPDVNGGGRVVVEFLNG